MIIWLDLSPAAAARAWTVPARAWIVPARDDRALVADGTPESRDYRLRWWDKDEAHGDWSLVQTVLVGA